MEQLRRALEKKLSLLNQGHPTLQFFKGQSLMATDQHCSVEILDVTDKAVSFCSGGTRDFDFSLQGALKRVKWDNRKKSLLIETDLSEMTFSLQ